MEIFNGLQQLFAITLTDLEKQQVNQYLNQAEQTTIQVSAQLPALKA